MKFDTDNIKDWNAFSSAMERLTAAKKEFDEANSVVDELIGNAKPSIVSPGPAPRKTRGTDATVAPNPVTGRTRKARTVLQPGEKRQRPISEAALEAVREALASGNHDSQSITEASKLTKPNALLALGRLVEAGEAVKTGTTKDARWALVTAHVAQEDAE